AERLGADRDRNRLAQIEHLHPALEPVGRLHRHRAHAVLPQVLLDLDDDIDRIAAGARRLNPKRVVDLGKMSGLELDVNDRSDDLDDPADLLCLYRHCDASFDIAADFRLSALGSRLSAFGFRLSAFGSRLSGLFGALKRWRRGANSHNHQGRPDNDRQAFGSESRKSRAQSRQAQLVGTARYKASAPDTTS